MSSAPYDNLRTVRGRDAGLRGPGLTGRQGTASCVSRNPLEGEQGVLGVLAHG